MKLKLLAAAAILSVSGLAGASTSWNLGSYTVTYDETTSGFGWLAGASFGGGGATSIYWAIDPSVQVTSIGGALDTATFALPDFTITVNPGYVTSGPLTASIGNIIYVESGAGATTSISAVGSVSVDAGPAIPLPAAWLAKTPTSATIGYFADSATAPLGAFTSFGVSGGSITLSASGGSFAAIGAQPQNLYKIEFYVNEVPEPETYALMLAGLGMVGWLARRRQR